MQKTGPGNDEHHMIVRYRISDTGIGMSEFQTKEFLMSSVRKMVGQEPVIREPGLGMAIAKQYVDLMGGKIDVNAKGIGSRIYGRNFLLIAEQILIEKEETLRKDMDLHGLHVLLAEDNDLTQR